MIYNRINYNEDRCGVTRQTAATYLNSLVDAGLLKFEKVGTKNIYKNTRLIDLFNNFCNYRNKMVYISLLVPRIFFYTTIV